MTTELTLQSVPQQATSDEHLVSLWLHGRSESTQRAYAADLRDFLSYFGKPLREVTLGDFQNYTDTLADKATAYRARKLASVKSLFSFGQKLGYIIFNIGAAVQTPKIRNQLALRIVDEASVHRLLALESNPRNAAILKLLYGAGLRISEVCTLAWRDVQPRRDGCQLNIFGKGGRTRVVLLPASIWKALTAIRSDDADPEAPVFRSQKGGFLDASAVHRVVKDAAKRAGLPAEFSAHWMRHAHVSHALDRGAKAHTVQATVGHASLSTTSRYAHARPEDSSALYLGL